MDCNPNIEISASLFNKTNNLKSYNFKHTWKVCFKTDSYYKRVQISGSRKSYIHSKIGKIGTGWHVDYNSMHSQYSDLKNKFYNN